MDDDFEVRLIAKGSIEQFGNRAVKPLRNTLKNENARFRITGAGILMGLVPEDKATFVPVLVGGLSDNDKVVRELAAQGLCNIGPCFPETILPLVGALSDIDSHVRCHAAHALASYGRKAKPGISSLINNLTDKDEFARLYAVVALGKIGPDAKSAVPGLIQAIRDEVAEVRMAAIKALWELGPSGPRRLRPREAWQKDLSDRSLILQTLKVICEPTTHR